MIVYHTSDIEIPHPDVFHSRECLDFGKGFYVTDLKAQAEKYSSRFLIRGRVPILNIYELAFQKELISYKRFNSYDRVWLDFVPLCRSGKAVANYDIIEGGIANDKVFDTIDLYFSGLISEEAALSRLAFIHPNWQICITSQAILDECLSFKGSQILKP